jgi:hypothetical protein
MAKPKTLFILGAGASKPYGYPTGIELRELILGRGYENIIIDALGDDYSELAATEKYHSFIDEFTRSSVYSIDSFLEHRPEFMKIGKISIAAALFHYENDGQLRKAYDNWYMDLFNRINTSFDTIDKYNISFITFNYDRSLEQFLFEAIRCRFGKDYNECIEKLNNIPIIHLYGQLVDLPWQNSNGHEYLCTSMIAHEKSIKRIREAPSNIKLINDERSVEQSAEFQNSYQQISEADTIYFLGFGFDETNLRRLKIENMHNKTIHATAQGIVPTKISWINNRFSMADCRKFYLYQGYGAKEVLDTYFTLE